MATKFITPNWRMPRNSNQSKASNYSITFSGNEYITVGSSSELDNVPLGLYSISFWLKFTSVANMVVSEKRASNTFVDAQFTVHLGGTGHAGELSWFGGAGGGTPIFSSSTLNDGNWHHIALVAESTSVSKMYIDGQLDVTSSTNRISSAAVAGTFRIGSNYGGSYRFSGQLCQYCIFDYALTSNAVTALYNSGIPANPLAVTTPPVAFYDLGQGSAYAKGSAGIVEPNLAAATGSTVFDFDGISQNVNCGDNDAFSFGNGTTDSPFSISAWFNADTLSGAQRFTIGKFDSGAEWLLQGRENSIWMNLYDSTSSSEYIQTRYTATINTNVWINVIFTYDGSGLTTGCKMYVNGSLVSTSNTKTSGYVAMGNKSSDLKIGARSGKEFDGKMSNVSIFNLELSSLQAETLYNNGTPLQSYTDIPQSGSLKAWYKLGQSANWEADSSGAWQIPDAVSAYPQSFDVPSKSVGTAKKYIETNINNLSDINVTDKITVSTWVNFDDVTVNAYNPVVQKGTLSNGTNMSFTITRMRRANASSEGQVYASIKNASGTAATAYSDANAVSSGKWANVVMRYDGANVKIYVNGKLHDSAAQTGNILDSTPAEPFSIGSDYYYVAGLGDNLVGKISNVQIWNTDLTDGGVSDGSMATGQIAELYNNGVPLTTAIASNNLKLWAKLDNTATFSTNWSVPDASGNGNTGTSSGMTEQNLVFNNVSALNGESVGMDTTNLIPSNLIKSIPYSGYSMDFDAGDSDYIDLGNLSNIGISNASATSVSMWFKKDGDGNYVLFELKEGSSKIALQSYLANKLYVYINGESYNVAVTVANDEWHNIMLVFNGAGASDADKLKVYFNGSNITGGTYSGTVPTSVGSFTSSMTSNIGRTPTTAYFDGKISNVVIWDKAITEDEILRVYNGGSPGDLSNLGSIGWWSLGADSYFDGNNWICPDLSANSNNGTSANMGAANLVGDGPDSLANGTSTNLDLSSDLVGNAPGSTGNSLSVNMNFTARTGSTP